MSPTAKKTDASLSAEERAAVKERTAELKAEGRAGRGAAKIAAEERTARKTIDEMPEPDRTIATRLHALIGEVAPHLTVKLRYGMPTYSKDGKIVCFFQAASKFDTRYPTLAFDEHAQLDDGTMWATSFALTEFTDANEKKIRELIEKAVG